MAWNLSIVCNEAGGSHLFLLPFAVAALVIYVVGVPVASLYWLWRNQVRVRYDQILRAQLTGDDKITNPHVAFRNTWKALYMNYRPGAWYWEFIICVRKFLIAFCSLMFRDTPSFQLAMALLVLFVAYILQVRFLPYLSHSVASETVATHRRLCLEGNAAHSRIDAEMRARAEYYKRSSMAKVGTNSLAAGGRSPSSRAASPLASSAAAADAETATFYASHRSRFEMQVLEGRTVILANAVATFVFDYNTAEATLLASAILVNLAGICFDSSRFTPEKLQRADIQAEYNSLAVAILVIMFLSIIYWFLAMGMDILLVSAPETVSKCLAASSAAGARALSEARRRAGVKGKEGSGGGGGGRGVDKMLEADPNFVRMDSNPLSALASDSSVLSAADIAQQTAPPDAYTWRAIRQTFASTDARAKALAIEVSQLRERLQDASDGAGGGGKTGSPTSPAIKGGKRSTFAPSAAGESAGSSKVAAAKMRISARKSIGSASAGAAAEVM